MILTFSLFVLLASNSCSSLSDKSARKADAVERFLDKGIQARTEGKLTEAVGLLTQGYNIDPKDVRLHYELGLCYLALGEEFAADPGSGGNPSLAFSDAESYFRSTLELDPAHPEAECMLARTLYLKGDSTGAMARIEAHLTRRPDDMQAHLLAGKALITLFNQQGEPAISCLDRAAVHLEKAIALDPELPESYIQLGDCLLFKKNQGAALTAYMKGVARCPESTDLHQRLLTYFSQSEHFTPKKAADFYKKLLDQGAKTPEQEGTILWYLGKWHDTQGLAEYRAEEYAKASEAYSQGAACFKSCGRACPSFRENALIEEAQAYANIGWCWCYAQKFDQSEAMFQKALALVPDLTNAVLGIDSLGTTIVETSTPEEARDFFKRAAMANPGNSKWWNNYGFFARDTGRHEEAYNAYAKAMALSPEDTRYINDCGMMLMYYLKRDQKKMEELFLRAQSIGEEKCGNPFLSDNEKGYHFAACCDAMMNLGRLYLLQNRIEECEPIVRSLLEKAPERWDVQELQAGLQRCKEGHDYVLPE